jgi:hypothetical protein
MAAAVLSSSHPSHQHRALVSPAAGIARNGIATAVAASPHSSAAASTTAGAAPTASTPAPAAAEDMNRFVVFTADKAGMTAADGAVYSKEHINKVIFENSVGSAHYKAQQLKNDRVTERLASMKRNIKIRAGGGAGGGGPAAANSSNPLALAAASRAQRRLHELETGRDLSRNWVHIDMDSFYASVEIRDRPDLADKPVAVGGMSMISTSNYVARKFGVRSAMPGFIAVKLCPQLIFLEHKSVTQLHRRR